MARQDTIILACVQVSFCSIDLYAGRVQPVNVPDMYARYGLSLLLYAACVGLMLSLATLPEALSKRRHWGGGLTIFSLCSMLVASGRGLPMPAANTTGELERVQLEQAKLEQVKLDIERERLELQRAHVAQARARLDRAGRGQQRGRLFSDHLGSMITAIVSLAAIFVTLAQVWVATQSKNKEISLLKMQQDQEWRFKALEFVTKNSDSFFGKNALRREQMANALAAAFPADVAGPLLNNLKQTATSQEARQTFADTEDRMHGMEKRHP